MILREVLISVTILFAVSMLVLTFLRLKPIFESMYRARRSIRWDQPVQRITSFMTEVFGHKRLFRNRLAGIIHLFIFSGFIVLLLDILQVLVQVFISPSFSIGVIGQFLVDTWVLIVLAGVVLAFYQRRVLRPERFKGSNEQDAETILGMIAIIVIGIVIHTSFFHLIAGPVYGLEETTSGHYLGKMITELWILLGLHDPFIASIGYSIGYFMDIGMILFFLAYLPKSKHLHVLFAGPAVFFRKLEPSSEIASANDKSNDGIEINHYEDFSWKDILDLYSCTECGRCQDVCPAYHSGLPLNPKSLILDLRDGLLEQIQCSDTSNKIRETIIAGNIISNETLWSCTTCGACQEACPVFIEHVPKIVGLRASLVEHGQVEERTQEVMESLIDKNNAYGKSAGLRPIWASKMNYPFKDARREPVDWLWFLGDVTSYDTDPGVMESIHSISTIFKVANINVGLLFEGESSSGNDVLRMGEYGLFEKLANQNMAAFKEADFQRIVTSDPHSFNALVNDYSTFDLGKPVYHYSQMLLELLEEGRLTINNPLKIRATYHDPCYLGRWNQIFDQPRQILERCGIELVEMPRNRMESFCCGAGGGRMWMNESGIQERPSESRIREALELPGVTHFIVSCPKDIVMYAAAVEALGCSEKIKVVDIAELLLTAVKEDTLIAHSI